ncbi:hypothetical protein A2U01_0062183, partial [Trifolium medium]|nr:hypothetical protein [Trifolium medium]
TTRSSLLATDPLPPLNRVYATLIQEERVKVIARSKEERTEIVGLVVKTGGRTRGRGYPDWWGDRPRHDTKGVTRVKGQQSQGRGRGMGVRANA